MSVLEWFANRDHFRLILLGVTLCCDALSKKKVREVRDKIALVLCSINFPVSCTPACAKSDVFSFNKNIYLRTLILLTSTKCQPG